MLSEWLGTTLGAICDLTKGATPTLKSRPGPYPLVVTAENRATSDEYQFDTEAVCVPMVSSTGHGHASLKRVHYQAGKFAVANIITACTAKQDAPIDMRYLWLLLDHLRDDLIVSLMKGTANVSLSQRALATVPLTLPPVPDQRRIVDLVGSLDDTISLLARQSMTAKQKQDSLRRYLLTGTREWSESRLGDVATPTTGRAFPPRYQGRRGGAYPYVKCSDMNGDGQERVITSASNWIDEAAKEQLSAKVLPSGTVIFPILGAALATEKRRVLGRPAAFDQNVMGLEPGPEITSEFLLAVMSEVRLSQYAQQGAVPSVNQSIVASIPIRLPPIDDQRRIDSLLSASAEPVTLAVASTARLRSVRAQLLTSLLSGDHEIPATYDADLLEEAS
jgi:restriction endonuclease S subunit